MNHIVSIRLSQITQQRSSRREREIYPFTSTTAWQTAPCSGLGSVKATRDSTRPATRTSTPTSWMELAKKSFFCQNYFNFCTNLQRIPTFFVQICIQVAHHMGDVEGLWIVDFLATMIKKPKGGWAQTR